MYPPTHFLVPFFIAEILVKLEFLDHKLAIIAGLIGFLIDIDHYIEFVIHNKDLNFKNAWNSGVLGKDAYERSFIHHKLGIMIITAFMIPLFFFDTNVFMIVFIGYYSHIFLDHKDLNLFADEKRFRSEVIRYKFNIPNFEIALNIIIFASLVPLLVL